MSGQEKKMRRTTLLEEKETSEDLLDWQSELESEETKCLRLHYHMILLLH